MNHKLKIHNLLNEIASELLEYIKECESSYEDRWVPAADIKRNLELNLVAVPLGNPRGEKGWLFGILARMLEEQNLVEYQLVNRRAYYRTKIA